MILILFFALANYQLAKVVQTTLLHFYPSWSYPLTISLPWIMVCSLPLLMLKGDKGLTFNAHQLRTHEKELVFLSGLVVAGLFLFVSLGVTDSFHSVNYPIIFFVVTPLVEELLFRGFIFEKLEKMRLNAVIGSSLLFGLHHLQYFNYIPTRFALFQIAYTFILGLLFGRMRKQSGSIYLSLILHVLINWVTVYY